MVKEPIFGEFEEKAKNLEREVVEKRLLGEHLQFLSLAIEQSSEGIAVSNLDGNLEYLNNAFAEMHGYSSKELVGKNLSIFHKSEQMPFVEAANRQIKETGDFKGEIWHVRSDGTVFPTIMHNSLVRNNEGMPIGMLATLRDISDMKNAEDKLRDSEEKYRKLVQDSIDGIVIVEGIEIKFVNQAVLRMFGFQSEEEMVGCPMTDMILPEYRELMVKRGEDRERGQDVIDRYEFGALRKDGTEFIAELFVSRIIDKGRAALQGVIRDITARKKNEEVLREAKDELERKMEERTAQLKAVNEDLKMETGKLEELNTALKVLLKKRDEDKIELEQKMLSNVEELVLPYLEKLKKGGLTESQKSYVTILESNLNNILSPFSLSMSSKYLKLTPAEIRVANLVKQDKTTKEIAVLLGLSKRTIDSYRDNIRKKIGIKNKKANLRTYLLSAS